MLVACTFALWASIVPFSDGSAAVNARSRLGGNPIITAQAQDPATIRKRLQDLRNIAPPDKGTSPGSPLPALPDAELRSRKDQALRTFEYQQRLDIERDLRDSLRK